jgi:hypothetical protein
MSFTSTGSPIISYISFLPYSFPVLYVIERYVEAMTQHMEKEPILQMGSNKMIPRHVYDKPFTVRFPDRSEWKKGFQTDKKGGLIWYTDGSKTKKRHWS